MEPADVAAIQETAGHGALGIVAVDQDRRRQRLAVARVEVDAEIPLHAAPAVVLAATAGGALEIDLLACLLADITDEQITVEPVEAEAPRVAETVDPDLVKRIAVTDKWIIRRDRIGVSCVDINTQDLAEQCIEALAVVVGVLDTASIPGRDVEVAIWPEVEVATVVVRGGLIKREQDLLAG